MLSQKELLYTLALQRTPNLGDTSAKKLLRAVGSAEAIFKEKKHNLLKIDGIGSFKLKNLNENQQLTEAEAELRFIKDNDIEFSYFLDKTYPERLKHCLDGPILFFHSGNIDLKNKKIISIVGTRKVTTYGTIFCEKLIEELAPLDPIIVSGFAYGVDITAHKAAMDNNLQTIACLAHGLNQIYPKVHKKYVTKVEQHGGFITEFWSDDPFDRNNFLKRNRIIAGLSEATIVIESAEKGGSLVTADIANSYNREVFAVPGRSSDKQSQGCNNLIKRQQAHLLTNAADLIYHLDWELEETNKKPQQTQLFVELTEEEKTIYRFLKQKDKELLDIIALECQIPTFKVATILLNMELKGVVRPLPGKLFQVV
ncbi:DNA-protecting protein DprA [Marixanthomonas sp. SCSIO 43207]|uniref:DNA-processing protein DprA n=1 Tax=Marixanthomonas sp. SCSIO 43207 TaxID=2779360 RepID=UPI001CA95626|nr:DNA-processing protein DprA [Marixanthomonas sp. SCSIO 43207]UAB81869.1 DNA-protecting protein DprA [Marixanthomonas sp. SCSIO 43207]